MTEAEARAEAVYYVACYAEHFDPHLEPEQQAELTALFVKALLAASRPGEGMIRTHEGKDLRVLGALAMTKDGAVCGNMFCDIWTTHRGTGKVYKTTPYHAGVRGGYSTAKAASAAKGVGDE